MPGMKIDLFIYLLSVIHCYMDTSYATHEYFKGHTSDIMMEMKLDSLQGRNPLHYTIWWRSCIPETSHQYLISKRCCVSNHMGEESVQKFIGVNDLEY